MLVAEPLPRDGEPPAMPRYRLLTATVEPGALDAALRLAATRFPEIAVEGRCEVAGRAEWVCRAPSGAHVRRWSAAARIPVTSLRPVAETKEQLP